MASTQTSLINYNFGGISRKDSSFSSELITCSDCQNIELYYTGLNSGVGIRTARGNEAVTGTYQDEEGIILPVVPSDENIIEIFESQMGGDTYFIVYTETNKDELTETNEGKLYIYNAFTGRLDLCKDGLSVTGIGCGCDFIVGFSDYFCFSNGEQLQYLFYDNNDILKGVQVQDMSECNLIDAENRQVKGLGMFSFDKKLWIFDGKVLWYSEQNNCKNFYSEDSGDTDITSAGYIEFVKPITAIYPYLGSLAVFHRDSSVLVKIDSITGYSYSDESPGGCASSKSLVFHGTDLFFYDDTKKGVFSFQQIVNGDKTLGDNIAYDIQEELMLMKDLKNIKALSVVTSDRNEIWLLTSIRTTYDKEFRVYNEEIEEWETEIRQVDASVVLIYDYLRGAWLKRKCQKINCIGVVNGTLYSAGKDIYRENSTSYFNGDFIPCSYTCTILNMGADNTLKITKFPPRITASGNYNCNFWVKYIKNYNDKKIKIKNVKAKYSSSASKWNDGTRWNDGSIWKIDKSNFTVKLPSATFKALQITFFTTRAKEEFCFRSIEFSKIKVKQV